MCVLFFVGIDFRALLLAAWQLTVRAPLLSIWEVARSQLEHVSLGLLELLPHDYDDDNEHGQQYQDAANGHSHHGAVTHVDCELFSSAPPLYSVLRLARSVRANPSAVWITKHLHISHTIQG